MVKLRDLGKRGRGEGRSVEILERTRLVYGFVMYDGHSTRERVKGHKIVYLRFYFSFLVFFAQLSFVQR